jgi:hypothetical protein
MKQIKPDGSRVVALFVGGAAILLLAFLSLPSHHIRLKRGSYVSREAHPVLYWSCEMLLTVVGVLCFVSGVRLLRVLIRQKRDLEQQAMSSFMRKHEGDRQ